MSRKLPALNADNRAFWQGGEHGLLQIHKCNDCTRFFHPVSYTHLDVYKRQNIANGLLGAPVGLYLDSGHR